MILLLLALAWLAGVVAAALGLASLWPVALLGGGGTCLGLVAGGNRRLALTGALALAVALLAPGATRRRGHRSSPAASRCQRQGSGAAARRHRAEPEPRERSQRFARAGQRYERRGAWQPATGSVLVTARPFPRFATATSSSCAASSRRRRRSRASTIASTWRGSGVVSLAPSRRCSAPARRRQRARARADRHAAAAREALGALAAGAGVGAGARHPARRARLDPRRPDGRLQPRRHLAPRGDLRLQRHAGGRATRSARWPGWSAGAAPSWLRWCWSCFTRCSWAARRPCCARRSWARSCSALRWSGGRAARCTRCRACRRRC